jgi:hypothetical protein
MLLTSLLPPPLLLHLAPVPLLPLLLLLCLPLADELLAAGVLPLSDIEAAAAAASDLGYTGSPYCLSKARCLLRTANTRLSACSTF